MLYKTIPVSRETLDLHYDIPELKQMCKKLNLKTEKEELIEKLVANGVTYNFNNRAGMYLSIYLCYV